MKVKKSSILQLGALLPCFGLSLLMYHLVPTMPDKTYQSVMLSLVGFGLVVFYSCHRSRYAHFRWLSVSALFSLSYLIVFFQIAMLDLLGYSVSRKYYEFVWASRDVVNVSVAISTIGLIAFFLGFSLSKRKDPDERPVSVSLANGSSTLLLIFAYISYGFFLATSGAYITGEYTPDDASKWSSYFYKLFKVSLSAVIILKMTVFSSNSAQVSTLKSYARVLGFPLLVLVFTHIGLSFFVGDRGPIVYFGLMAFGLFIVRTYKINFAVAAIAVIILSSLLTVMGEVRQSRGSGATYSDRVVSTVENAFVREKTTKWYESDVPMDQTVELALSVRTLNHALANVPERHDYFYGLFQLKYFYSIVPGISNLVNRLVFDGNKMYDGSSSYITYLIQGPRPTSGDGSSVVADLYLDFGLVGVIIGLAIFGLFLGRYEHMLFSGYHTPGIFWIAIMVYFSNSIYLGRSALMQELSNVLLIYVFIRVNQYIMSKYRAKPGDTS